MNSYGRFISLCALWLTCSTAVASENYCDNPAVDAEWEHLLLQYEGDAAFSYLYSLRQDLCDEVDLGKITLNDAIGRFETARQRVINNRLERLQESRGSTTGTG